MSRKEYVFIDTETRPIESRPNYPPNAVGYAVQTGRRARYLSFNHPSGNTHTRREAIAELKDALRGRIPVFHNADFDIEVLAKDGIQIRGEFHDTMRLAFLNDPHSPDLGLKPQAERWLEEPPEERDLLRAWILENFPAAKRKPSSWGDYIHLAPAKIVAPYAKGDTMRTNGLFKFFRESTSSMSAAYEREMKLVPIVLKMEQQGIRVRIAKLKKEIGAYRKVHDDVANQIRRRLKSKDLKISSGRQLAEVLVQRGLLHTVMRTKPSDRYPDGQVSTKRSVLEQNCTDRTLVQLLAVHGTLSTYLNTFMQTWIDIAEEGDNYVRPSFNTVRAMDDYGAGRGTRTGRFSSSDPNFQAIPSSLKDSPHFETLQLLSRLLAKEGVKFVGLREYFAPDDGCVFLRRDYSQQELRFLAHFEEGAFLKMYLQDPRMDAHDAVRELVRMTTGVLYPRKHIKITNFGIIYGMGIAKLAARLGISMEEARRLRNAVLSAIKGIKDLNRYLKGLARRGDPYFTWGGRRYYCEEPQYQETEDGGRERRSFEYKMLNTLIQGSAADCTKEGMINVEQNLGRGSRIVLQVHDELVCSVPREHAQREMRRMREAMEDVDLRLPMLSDGEMGVQSWGTMIPTDSTKTGDLRVRWPY